jgi:hypothetical protein
LYYLTQPVLSTMGLSYSHLLIDYLLIDSTSTDRFDQR